ncbi:FAD-dependent monooxygenase [Pseudonocardia xinjiangensis]|uniref:FAD-dependent monooxygenase n=1 Tax=Pseudonocardia xinjiangensis TaxID=75289 RepID=UPI003D8D6D32
MDHGEHGTNGRGRARRALIAGAGIAGLATATRLGRIGWETLIVERAPGRRSSGYLVNLVGPGYDAAEQLGILPELEARDLGTFTSILVKADGRHKFAVPQSVVQAALGGRAVTVFRGDLESALYRAVQDDIEIRFATTVARVEDGDDGVSVTLSDGSTERVDLLVGADGLHSGVRAAVIGAERDLRVDLGLVVAAFPLDDAPASVPDASGTTFIGPGRTAAVINLGSERSSAFFTYRCPDPDAELARGAADALAAAFGDLGGGVPDALRQLAANPSAAYFDSVSQIVADRWSSGRVVLLGDAAWCVTLFAGYGATLAMTGADRLGTALEDAADIGVTAALDRWEAALRPTITKRQAAARAGVRQYAPPTQAHVWLTDMTMRAMLIPAVRRLVEKQLHRANR